MHKRAAFFIFLSNILIFKEVFYKKQKLEKKKWKSSKYLLEKKKENGQNLCY